LTSLFVFVLAGNPVAVHLTETWLCSDIVYIQNCSFLIIPFFRLHSSRNWCGGGVAIYTKL